MDVRVGIVMGSDSDLDTMRGAVDALAGLGIGCEVRVLSAHQTPDETLDWARGAAERGLAVLIAGAGAATHLPGVVAAVTSLPVIGVPIYATALAGVDVLISVAQMEPGMPVATVGIDAARNAGLLAARILGVVDPQIRERYDAFREEEADKLRAKDERVRNEFDPDRKAPGIGFGAP